MIIIYILVKNFCNNLLCVYMFVCFSVIQTMFYYSCNLYNIPINNYLISFVCFHTDVCWQYSWLFRKKHIFVHLVYPDLKDFQTTTYEWRVKMAFRPSSDYINLPGTKSLYNDLGLYWNFKQNIVFLIYFII